MDQYSSLIIWNSSSSRQAQSPQCADVLTINNIKCQMINYQLLKRIIIQ